MEINYKTKRAQAKLGDDLANGDIFMKEDKFYMKTDKHKADLIEVYNITQCCFQSLHRDTLVWVVYAVLEVKS